MDERESRLEERFPIADFVQCSRDHLRSTYVSASFDVAEVVHGPVREIYDA